jgi:hypothetical protein
VPHDISLPDQPQGNLAQGKVRRTTPPPAASAAPTPAHAAAAAAKAALLPLLPLALGVQLPLLLHCCHAGCLLLRGLGCSLGGGSGGLGGSGLLLQVNALHGTATYHKHMR